jgi:hypothetical protein
MADELTRKMGNMATIISFSDVENEKQRRVHGGRLPHSPRRPPRSQAGLALAQGFVQNGAPLILTRHAHQA